MKLLSRSDMPDERNIVPFGPCLSPGIWDTGAAAMLREKLLVRGLFAAIIMLIYLLLL